MDCNGLGNGGPSTYPPESLMKILLATDIHLGYGEKDPVRGDDSFTTFEEILSLAASNEVDMILLGGDLFHDNRPTMQCIHRCMALIRKYCLGDRPVAIEFLSDQSANFQHCVNPIVNYEDPNLNISIPVFSIHGNHDDPTGFGRTCSLDLLSATGLVNYFGKWEDLSQIKVSPILLSKGDTQLALYGLSHIKDQRLSRLFREEKVHMFRPVGASNEDWFNLFVLHQNRVERGANNFVGEDVLPEFFDLVFWGHEHECRVEAEYNARRQFYVTQPGSPVATSLCEGEAVTKQVAVLKIYKKHFKLEPIKLQTVRPFLFDSIVLSQCTLPEGGKPSDNVQDYVTDYLDTMLEKVDHLLTGHPRQPVLPLLRLRVDYSDENQMFNVIRFGQAMSDKVANPTDMILLRREKRNPDNKNGTTGELDEDALDAAWNLKAGNTDRRVEQVLEDYFKIAGNEGQALQVLSVRGLCEGVMQFVDKGDKEALDDVVTSQKEKTIKYLTDSHMTEENIWALLEEFREKRSAKPEDEILEARKALAAKTRVTGRLVDSDEEAAKLDEPDEDDEEEEEKPAKGRGRGRATAATRGPRGGRGARAAPAARGGRGKKAVAGQTTLAESFSSGRQAVRATNARASTARKAMFVNISDSDDD